MIYPSNSFSQFRDVNAQFQNALLLGDVPSRIRLLLSAGQIQLAYMTAITHGLEDMAEQIRAKLQHISGSEEPLGIPGALNSTAIGSVVDAFGFVSFCFVWFRLTPQICLDQWRAPV